MKSQESSVIQIGAWRVDSELDEISRDGQTTKLEPKMMQLLLCLTAHAGQVMSVEQLLDEVWKDVVVTPDSVYHAVAALRRVLGDDSKNPTYIANVMRRGYRLIAPALSTADTLAPRLQSGDLNGATQATSPSAETPRTQPIRNLDRRTFGTAILAVLALALACFIADRVWISKRFTAAYSSASVGHETARPVTAAPAAAIAPPPDSIAVLPFMDLSQEHDQQYFADGMAEEVLDLLTGVPGLKVIGRSSSFQFKGQNQDLRKIGDALGVRYVVEGTVRRSGEQVRVTAQLIDTTDGSHLWSDKYDEPMGNVLALQDRIAAGLVRALQLSIEAEDYAGGRHSFKSSQAYDLYLRGIHAWQTTNKEGLETAIAYFQRALDLDPNAVAAAELLAGAQESLAELSYVAPQEGFERARHSAQHALALNPQSWEAHLILSGVHLVYDWDWAAAEQDAQAALRLQPHDSETLQGLAKVYEAVGRWDEGIRLTQSALALDPFDPGLHLLLGNLRTATGELGVAEAEVRRMLQVSPFWGEGHFDLGGILLLEGKFQAALAEMQLEQTAWSRYAGLAMVYHAMGRHADSDAALAAVEKGGAQDYASEIADAYAYRGEADPAFMWLERAYRQKDTALYFIKIDVFLARLKSDPRYVEFLRKMNLPE